jgi:hypothetical protein
MPSRLFASLTALIILLCLMSLPAGARDIITATDKNPKPDDPFFSPSRAVFDCTGRDTLDLSPWFNAQIADSTNASENNLPGYACRAWSEEGPENIYRLEVTQALELFAALRAFDDISSPPDEDLDIFLLSDCDTDSCLAGANLEFSITLPAGTYYLVVDGYGTSSPAEGFYTLLLECRELGVPVQICEPGGATPVSPGAETAEYMTNLFSQPNLVQTYACSPIVERGGEAWYAVTVEPHHEFTATTTLLATTLDVALWIFDGCGPEAVCLDFADDKLAGQPEALTLVNDADAALTVYLALDSYRPAASEALGEVTLEIQGVSNVPTVKKSLGSVRSLYR